MKRLIRVLLPAVAAAVFLGGCALHTVGATVAIAPPPPPVPVVVAHVHGPECGHFWGYYSGYPVYYYGGAYTYWNGAIWAPLPRPPAVVYRGHYRHYAPHGHVYRGSPKFRAHPRQQHRDGNHRAVPVR